MKKRLLMLLTCILTCTMLVGCSGSGKDTGKREETKTIYDTDSDAYIQFNTKKGTAKVCDLYYYVEEVDVTFDISSRKAVTYDGTYAVGETITFTYECKADKTDVTITLTVPKNGNKTKIEYKF